LQEPRIAEEALQADGTALPGPVAVESGASKRQREHAGGGLDCDGAAMRGAIVVKLAFLDGGVAVNAESSHRQPV
jgi:hypothetical protein